MLHLCRDVASDECREVAVRELECFLSTGCVMTEVHQRRINLNSKQIFLLVDARHGYGGNDSLGV